MLLLNLALGPGWPIDKTPNPSVMEVDYVPVYAKVENKLLSCAGHDRPVPDAAAERSDIH
jgi:hypothetical protein